MILASRDSATERISFSSLEMKGETSTVPLDAEAIQSLLFRSVAETLDAKIILITHEAFKDRYKPAAHDFALCAEGRLLIISLGLPAGTDISYPICSRMNDLAKTISEM